MIAHSPLATSLASLQVKDPGKALDNLARANCRTVAQIALNWCLSKQGIVTIPKTNSVAHVKENCAASDFRLSVEEVQLLNRSVRCRGRGQLEMALRRVARQLLQVTGKNQ